MSGPADGSAPRPRDNPFRSARVDALPYLPQGLTWPEIESRLVESDFRGEIVAPHGHGKSRLMLELTRRLGTLLPAEEKRYLQVMADGSADGRVCDALRHRSGVLLLDGYDLLGWRLRRAARRRPRTIVTSHRATRLPTLMRCETDPTLLATLIEQLAPGVRSALDGPQIAALYARHAGNLRDALRELYDRYADGEFVTTASSA